MQKKKRKKKQKKKRKEKTTQINSSRTHTFVVYSG
jgi:hypothetical protein